MNCKFCGAELEEGLTLCSACGKENTEEVTEEVIPEETAEAPAEEITEEPAEETPEETAEEITEETTEEAAEETPAEPAEAPKKKRRLLGSILALVGAVALVVVLVGAVLYGMGVFDSNPDTYVVSDAKAAKSRDAVVATCGDVELTNSELQIYYQQAFEEFYNYYAYYMDLSTIGLDTTKPLSQQYYDAEKGVTWESYFMDTALNTWHRYAVLNMQAKEDGYELDAETLAYLDTIPAQLDSMAQSYGYANAEELLDADLGPACDIDGYLKYVNSNYFAGQYFDSLYDSLVPTMEEVEAYYAENAASLESMGITKDTGKTVDVRHILLCPQGGTEAEDGSVTYSDAEWESCRVEAQRLLDEWAAEDGTEEGFAQYAMEHTEDPGSMQTGGLYTDVYVGQMVPEFNDWCFDESRAYGDTGLVKTTYGYHIMFYVADHEIWISSVEDEIINTRSMEIVTKALEKWPMEVNHKKIVLGDTTTAE